MPFRAYPPLRIAAPRRTQVLDRLADWRPTLVHATTPFGIGLAGRAVARSLGVPFVTSVHTAYASYLRCYRRLAPEKGVDVAIGAVRRLMERHPGRVRLVVAGDGPHERRCRAMAPEGSWFAGMLGGERLFEIYASADALIFPSTTETFGNVLLEGMTSGLPIVAPDRGPRAQKRGASLRTAAARSWNAVWDRLFQDYLDVVTSAAPRTAIV